MPEINLLDTYPQTTRQRQLRSGNPADAAIARKFGREYFDGDRRYGYGGYRYDGRWHPVAERIRDFYDLRPGNRVLDVGCAKGYLCEAFWRLGIIAYGLDMSHYALTSVTPHKGFIEGTADKLPFPDGCFDLAVCINVLHNLPLARCELALTELTRVASRQYVQVDSWLTPEQKDNLEHWQLTVETVFDPNGWQQVFERVGFTGEYYWTVTT